jgi:serine/threonine protein kinase
MICIHDLGKIRYKIDRIHGNLKPENILLSEHNK